MEKVLCIEDLERKLEQFQIILTNSDNVKKDILELTEQMVEMVANYKKTQIDFQLICNHLNTTLFVTDDRGYVCYVNPSYEERTGLKKEYILGKTIYELQKENVIQCDVIPRMLKDGVRAVVEKDSYPIPPIFTKLAKEGNVDEYAMYNTYNMGLGMILAVDAADVDKTMEAIKAAGETPYVVGEIKDGEKGVTLC